MIRVSAFLALLLVWFAPGMATAQDFGPFLGHWKGSGISETEDSIYFAVTVRDMDVVIEPVDDNAFRLTWTTITRESGDPNNPEVESRSASITFRATGDAGVYRDEAVGNPLANDPVWWSRIEGDVLFTYMMRIREDGTWQVQKYTREISGQGMTLTYERFTDGEPDREVRGRLVKHSD